MLPTPKFILYLMKVSKTRKIHRFSLKNWATFFIPAQLSFSLTKAKKELYGNIPEMFNFNSKTSIQKYPDFFS